MNSKKDVIENELLKQVNALDIKKFGIIPELLGRLPVVVSLLPLDREALKKILSEPKNSLVKQYIKLFEYEGKKLVFKENAIDFIIDKAMEYQLGARGLRSICEVIMTELMYESADSKSKTITIDDNLANELFEKNNTFALAS